jgi:hypothetical protein
MRSLTTVIVATVTATLLAGGVTPAAAESEQTAAARAVAGRMLVAPSGCLPAPAACGCVSAGAT